MSKSSSGATVGCAELRSQQDLPSPEYERFARLHPDGRRLIKGWFARASRLHDSGHSSPLEAFIYVWISFNGWASCVTQLDFDRQWVNSLAADHEISAEFSRAVASHVEVSQAARLFASYWPIFEVRHLRRRGLLWHGFSDRAATIRYFIDNGATECEPKCRVRHLTEGSPIPLDWPHTLSALYRVRCNLFHGEKSLQSEDDKNIVSAALTCSSTCDHLTSSSYRMNL